MTHLAPPDVLNDDYHALAHAWRVAVLSPLAFPPSCKVHFHPVRPQDVIHSARLLNSCRDIEAFACMKLATGGLHSVHMHMSHKPWPMEDPPPTSFLIHPLPASATLSHFGEMELARGRLRSTLSTPEFAHIRQLILLPNMLEWLFTSRRNNLLHTFRDLTHLCVTVNGFSEEEDPCMPVLARIFATLCPPQDNGRGKQSQNAPPACPALAHLWLEWVINKRWMRDSPVLLVSARIYLQRALAARAARGYPLTSVFISRGRYGDPRGPPKVALEEYDSAEAQFGKTELVGDEGALFKRLQPHWAPTLKSH
ncbi:hypothetical protein C2E23DRAFT_889753 [Lenzites betulinus]|nr:hypothetical protein C2E23DRAFT_889753 [Lenzites betulinus]